jgi:L-ascorbate metabolism protein UlaG (beta-lactamase superfamily)
MRDEKLPAAHDAAAEHRIRVTYIGHATLLIQVGEYTFLTDPNFDPALGRFLRRVSPPGIALDALPKLDGILVTHAHADHLSFTSLDALPKDIPLFAPPPIERWLNKMGYKQAVPIAPGEDIKLGELVIHAESATHSGARYGFDTWRSAANMYLLESELATCFFAGDTGLTPTTHDLVQRTLVDAGRQLDIAMLPIGYAPSWKRGFRKGHLTSDDALALFERMGARYLIPYHWGTFHHVTSGPFDAIERLRGTLKTHAREPDVKVLEPGKTFEILADPKG